MTRAFSIRILASVAILGIAALTACATPAAPGGKPPAGIAAPGEVLGQGTVLQIGEALPQFCLGPIAESYPPQCSGPDVVGWDWAGLQGSETSGDVTWGGYAVQGTWDGTVFTVTAPPMWLALYDPIHFVDPKLQPENAGATSEDRLREIQDELFRNDGLQPLTSSIENGYLFVTFLYDDGDIQRHLDDLYSGDVVEVRSAFRDVSN
jgi:hypothetical protein